LLEPYPSLADVHLGLKILKIAEEEAKWGRLVNIGLSPRTFQHLEVWR
jgi:hypothetical protein